MIATSSYLFSILIISANITVEGEPEYHNTSLLPDDLRLDLRRTLDLRRAAASRRVVSTTVGWSLCGAPFVSFRSFFYIFLVETGTLKQVFRQLTGRI